MFACTKKPRTNSVGTGTSQVDGSLCTLHDPTEDSLHVISVLDGWQGLSCIVSGVFYLLEISSLLRFCSSPVSLATQDVVVLQADCKKVQAWHTECASILDETSLATAQHESAAAPSAAPEAGYLFEGQLSQVTCCPYLQHYTYAYLHITHTSTHKAIVLQRSVLPCIPVLTLLQDLAFSFVCLPHLP